MARLMTDISHSPLTLVDLFSGACGATRGFLPRQRWPEIPRFAAVGAIDFDPSATATYAYNFPGTAVIRADLTALRLADVRGLLHRFGLRTGQLDVLVACPP